MSYKPVHVLIACGSYRHVDYVVEKYKDYINSSYFNVLPSVSKTSHGFKIKITVMARVINIHVENVSRPDVVKGKRFDAIYFNNAEGLLDNCTRPEVMSCLSVCGFVVEAPQDTITNADDVIRSVLRYFYEADKLLQALKEVRKKSHIPLWWLSAGSVAGICTQLNCIKFNLIRSGIFTRLIGTWSEYSGYPAYPISTTESKTPKQQYIDAIFHWSPYTKYGKARRRLLDHLISCLEQSLE